MENQIIDDTESRSKARLLLKGAGWAYVQAPDWVAANGDEWVIVEVKDKELWEPGANFPHWGIGLDKSQIFLRNKFQEGTGLRTYLLCYAKGTDDVYGAFLSELEAKGGYFDTKNKIRVYPLEHFKKIITVADLPFGETKVISAT